jgi:hypothetical protein
MTLAELNTALQSITGFKDKVAYRAFPVGKAPKLPFICYLATSTDNFDADNSVYHVLQGVDIELYIKDKSEATEQLIEAKLNEINLVWNKYEEWLDSEECYEIVYSITL